MRKQNSWSIVIHKPSNSTTAILLILSLGFQLRLLKRILIYFPEIKAMSTCVQNLAKLQSYRLLFIKDSVCLHSHMISTFIIDLISSHTHILCCAGQTDPDWHCQKDLHRWRNQAHKSFSLREGQLNPHTQYETSATTSGEMPAFKPKAMAGKWKKRNMKKRKQIPQHLDPSQNNF